MGLAITLGATVLDNGTALTNWALIGDGGTVNTDVFPPGASSSLSAKFSNEVGVAQYDDGTTGTFAAGDHFGIWYNFLFGALSTRAAGGIRFRVSGATATDFAEVYVGGIDDGKSGWQYVVVSLDRILSNPDNVGGTPPTAASAIQFVGVAFNITATVGGNNDNCAWQAVSHFPAGTPALRLEGTGTGASGEFDWNTIASAVEAQNYRGYVLKDNQGVFILNAPLEIGDTTVSSVDTNLVDTGVVLAWAGQEYVDNDFFGLTVSSNATDVVEINAGTKLGSGETATGVGGWTIITGGPRWFLDSEDTNTTGLNLYGCAFSGSGPWTIDDDHVEVISCVFSNCDTMDITGNRTAGTGPTMLSNFFSAAPGPRAQIVWKDSDGPANGQFDFNGFANMKWFAMEIPTATTQFDLRGVTFSGNGTNRDVLLSHTTGDIQLNVLEGGGTPGVTNGATITVTMAGACDVLMVSAGTWSNAVGTETNDLGSATGTLVTQTTASLSVNDDTFAIAAAVPGFKPDPGVGDSSITYSGASDEYEDGALGGDFSEFGGVLARIGADEITAAAATRTGFPVHTEAETEAVQGIIHVDSDADAIPVVNLDADLASGLPGMRPWQVVRGATAITFSYGAGNSDSGKGTVDAKRFAYIAVVALDGAAANTAVSTIDLNITGPSTQAFSNRSTQFPQQDDNVGGTGRSLELSVYDLDVDTSTNDLDQGTYDVNNNVTVTVTGLTEGATVLVEATGAPLTDGDDIGTFPTNADANGDAAASHSYTSDQPVRIRARYSGHPIAALTDDVTAGDPWTDMTSECNDSTAGNVILMPATEAIDDSFYMGFHQIPSKLTFDIDTARAGTWSLTFEYFNGSWTALSGVVDGTSDFSVSGNVTFTKPTDSTAQDLSSPEGSPTTTALHWVRARISSFTSAGAGPTATKVNGNPTKYLPFVGSATIESTGLTVPAVWVEDTIAR